VNLHIPAFTFGDQSIDVSPGMYRMILHGDDKVTGLNAALFRRAPRFDVIDHRSDILGADKGEEPHVDEYGKQQVEHRTGCNDQDPFENVLVGKRVGDHLLVQLCVGLVPHHFDIPAQWNRRKSIVGQSDRPSEHARAESQGKFFDADTEQNGQRESVPTHGKK
jgi:hypothetical protein